MPVSSSSESFLLKGVQIPCSLPQQPVSFILRITIPIIVMISHASWYDGQPLLYGETLCRTSSSYSSASSELQALPLYRKSLSLSSESSVEPSVELPRKALHHHKDPKAYADLPIFENPCPLCFFEHCHTVLRTWIKRRSTLSRLSRSKSID